VYLTPGGTVSGLSILGGTTMGRKGSILADDGCIYVGLSEVRVCKSPDVNLYTHSVSAPYHSYMTQSKIGGLFIFQKVQIQMLPIYVYLPFQKVKVCTGTRTKVRMDEGKNG
jgi:hypothetical protein